MTNEEAEKIFTITSEFDLIKKPKWLDDFRIKYDKPYSYHVTLKTSSYLADTNIENIKNELSKIAQKQQRIKVKFNKLFISVMSKGGCIMIKGEDCESLGRLQKEICEKVSKYGKHISAEYKMFENKFNPHITIARNLNPMQLKNAKKELQKNLESEALIQNLILTIVDKDTFDEWSNKQNKTYFNLL